jgi:hypothetical protein
MLAFLFLAACMPAFADSIDLVREGHSPFVIYHDAAAPSSVAMAAVDLQRYVHEAGGVELAIVQKPATPMICLGENAASEAAGLTAAALPWEGYRMVTKDGNVFILGRDTADDQRTPDGGTSAGTRNGTYAFLEQFLGVRWLAPGEHGDYVPKADTIRIPATDQTDAPFFLNRRVPYTQERRAEVQRWWARQRLGWSLLLIHSHNWRRSIPASHYDTQPEWFPEHGGVRVPPTGHYKLCTTNAGMIRAYADAAIDYFDRNPAATCYSLSPSDSAGYCECEKCTALYETDPNGNRSVTPAILTFYNTVAKLVARRHPDKLLAGYVYAAYVFPPKTPIPLEPNVFLVWAPSFDYGFTLFRPELQKQWEDLLAQWTQVTRNLSYYDLPVNISTEAGALNPPGLKILKFIYPRLKAADVKGVYVYGIEAWGRGGPLNYLLARLAWNPEADVEALFDEYCAKAYGKGGDEINRMYRLLDAEMERHFLEYSNARYHLTPDMMRDVYGKNFAELERLYREAEAKVDDSDAAARLAMIGDNLTVLHWNLRQFKMLDHPDQSGFDLADADFFEFLRTHRGTLSLHPADKARRPLAARQKLTVAAADGIPGAQRVTPYRLRGDQHLVLQPVGNGAVEVKFEQVTARGKLLTYYVYDDLGKEVTSGLVSAEAPVKLEATDRPYYHFVISAGSASFMLKVTGAAWAVNARLSNQGLHLLGKATPLYFDVPEAVASFHVSLEASPPGETAQATLYAPHGRSVAQFDCTRMSVDHKWIDGPAGWWKLDVQPAATGAMDDVWVRLGEELPGYFSLDPERALDVAIGK